MACGRLWRVTSSVDGTISRSAIRQSAIRQRDLQPLAPAAGKDRALPKSGRQQHRVTSPCVHNGLCSAVVVNLDGPIAGDEHEGPAVAGGDIILSRLIPARRRRVLCNGERLGHKQCIARCAGRAVSGRLEVNTLHRPLNMDLTPPAPIRYPIGGVRGGLDLSHHNPPAERVYRAGGQKMEVPHRNVAASDDPLGRVAFDLPAKLLPPPAHPMRSRRPSLRKRASSPALPRAQSAPA